MGCVVHGRSASVQGPGLQVEAQRGPAQGELGDGGVRRAPVGEEPPPGHAVSRRQPPSGSSARPHRGMAQPGGDAPVLPHPGQRLRVARPAREQGVRHREQRVQVEQAGRALPVPRRGLGLVRLERGAELPGQGRASYAGPAPDTTGRVDATRPRAASNRNRWAAYVGVRRPGPQPLSKRAFSQTERPSHVGNQILRPPQERGSLRCRDPGRLAWRSRIPA